MKRISLRDFRLKANDYMDDLPVELTRYNTPVARVSSTDPTKRQKLTTKQAGVIADAVKGVREGGKLKLAESVEKIYNVSSIHSARSIATANWGKEHFREALLNALEERKIIGADSKVEKVLTSGLDAEKEGEVDHRTRLDYAKEINKISGVYAAEKKETKTMKLNMDLSEEELNRKINALREELKV